MIPSPLKKINGIFMSMQGKPLNCANEQNSEKGGERANHFGN